MTINKCARIVLWMNYLNLVDLAICFIQFRTGWPYSPPRFHAPSSPGPTQHLTHLPNVITEIGIESYGYHKPPCQHSSCCRVRRYAVRPASIAAGQSEWEQSFAVCSIAVQDSWMTQYLAIYHLIFCKQSFAPWIYFMNIIL